MSLQTVHPFPARMAPELARKSVSALPTGALVLDPMCGSGTVLRVAVERGLDCIGVDVDPLSVLMSRVWTTPLDSTMLHLRAIETANTAKTLSASEIKRITDDNTRRFIIYWFARQQRLAIMRLATVLARDDGPMRDALFIALSRIIVTKEMMASLARDTSHSRPHRVASNNDFDVYAGFVRSAKSLAKRLQPERISGTSSIYQDDARSLEHIGDDSVDLVLTSPPYLNAIDYLRGHRLALVWLGYSMDKLRHIRADSVGAERKFAGDDLPIDVGAFVTRSSSSTFGKRQLGWVNRYAKDMHMMLRQLRRVVRQSGKVVLVIGDSFLRGARVENARLVRTVAQAVGFEYSGGESRSIPARRRYLPPPGRGTGALDVRMREETILMLTG